MNWEGFELTTQALERAKTVHALDLAATAIGQLHLYVSEYDAKSEFFI
jgi:hypothetical protein